MKTEQFQQFDPSLNRTLVRNYSENSLIIIGDYSASSVTTFWVVNKFCAETPECIFISRDSAMRHRDFCNKKYNTDTFIVISRTIFV